MLQAWIASSRGSLYFAATPTPYNLQTLRTHMRALAREGEGQVRLALTLGVEDEEAACPEVTAFLAQLAPEGIQVSFSVGVESGRTPAPQRRHGRVRESRARPPAATRETRLAGETR